MAVQAEFQPLTTVAANASSGSEVAGRPIEKLSYETIPV